MQTPPSLHTLKQHLMLRTRLRRILRARAIARPLEALRLAMLPADGQMRFFVVSCERNAGEAALNCLDSVYNQRYNREQVDYLFIDDASTDNTRQLVEGWLRAHPDHNVEFVPHAERRGGTANTIDSFRAAPPGTVVVELNGDDWLPDPAVLCVLDKLYRDPNVWMTYNTHRFADGRISGNCFRIPEKVLRENTVREHVFFMARALRTFRRELFEHVKEESLIDPQTGEYWSSVDDQAIFLSMLELAGFHARHISRVMYVYNHHGESDDKKDEEGTRDRERRIRALPKYAPLESL